MFLQGPLWICGSRMCQIGAITLGTLQNTLHPKLWTQGVLAFDLATRWHVYIADCPEAKHVHPGIEREHAKSCTIPKPSRRCQHCQWQGRPHLPGAPKELREVRKLQAGADTDQVHIAVRMKQCCELWLQPWRGAAWATGRWLDQSSKNFNQMLVLQVPASHAHGN